MRPASIMIFRLLLISEDSQLITSVHALELRRIANGRGNNVLDLLDSSIEVTFVSSAVSRLTAVEAAVETNVRRGLLSLTASARGSATASIVQTLRVRHRGCASSTLADSGGNFRQPMHQVKTVAAQTERFRHGSIESDQLTQLGGHAAGSSRSASTLQSAAD